MSRRAHQLLVMEGNTAEMCARQRSALGYDTGEGYRRILNRIDPQLHVDIVRPADGDSALPAGKTLTDYDGMAITGSALNIYQGGEAVDQQLSFVRQVAETGLPLFGSCWGLQITASVAGGTVERNPKGREFGYAQPIRLSELGRAHPMYRHKPTLFRAPTIHLDTVTHLPMGAEVLATNHMGLQATAFTCINSPCWAVQYHPEYDPIDLAAVAMRYGNRLVEEGLYSSESSLRDFVDDLHRLQAEPDNSEVAQKYALDVSITDQQIRFVELTNWLTTLVKKSHSSQR